MKIAVTGSIATDHLMHFPGRFAEQLLADQLHKVSLSFLVDDLVVRRGGIGGQHRVRHGPARPAPGPGRRGRRRLRPTTASWLERHGVDCDSVHVSEIAHTARFVCTTDDDMCQIASFYAGAMSEARNIELRPGRRAARRPRPGADQRRTTRRRWSATPQECRERGLRVRRRPVAAAGPDVRRGRSATLIDGAAYLFTNEYEKDAAGVEDRAHRRRGARPGRRPGHHARQGRRARSPAGASTRSTCRSRQEIRAYDPTGVGDGFRAGFFAALSLGPGAGARRPGRLAARHAGAGDRRHPGVRAAPDDVRQAPRRVLRRRRRRRDPGPPARAVAPPAAGGGPSTAGRAGPEAVDRVDRWPGSPG